MSEYAVNEIAIESPIDRQHSLESFPLPPTTPVAYTKKPSSDLNRNFRFPAPAPISYVPKSPVGNTVRLTPVPVTPKSQIHREPIDIEKTPIEQTIKAVSELLHGRAISPPAVLQPLKYDPPPSGIPFKEFSNWDLDEEDAGSDLDGEALILSHSTKQSNLPAPSVTIRPDEEGLPGPVRKYLLAQERDRVLRETKRAEMAVVDAGFDFGFGNTEPATPTTVTVPPVSAIEILNPASLPEKSPVVSEFPSSPDSIAESDGILSHSDSGIAIDSKTMLKKSKTIMHHKSYHDFGQPKPRDGKVWRLTPSPDLGQETLIERTNANEARRRRGSMGAVFGGMENTIGKERRGFWGKMKNTVLLRKG